MSRNPSNENHLPCSILEIADAIGSNVDNNIRKQIDANQVSMVLSRQLVAMFLVPYPQIGFSVSRRYFYFVPSLLSHLSQHIFDSFDALHHVFDGSDIDDHRSLIYNPPPSVIDSSSVNVTSKQINHSTPIHSNRNDDIDHHIIDTRSTDDLE